MKIKAFITHKKAEHFIDCQDRFSVNIDTKSIALSDGMGSTWQQKIWADLLVKTYTESENWLPEKESIKELCTKWKTSVLDFIEKLKKDNAPQNIIYRNERNLAEGKSAGATFVGIRFSETSWKGTVLGDSCLISWDGKKTLFFTSQKGDVFDSYPDYFDSNSLKEGKGEPKPIEGEISKGTTLFLVSDPFSEFLLKQHKENKIKDYITQLIDISSHDQFESLVSEWREKGMHNDDTTLTIICPSTDSKMEIETIDDIEKFIDDDRRKAKEEDSLNEEACNQVNLEEIVSLISSRFNEQLKAKAGSENILKKYFDKYIIPSTIYQEAIKLYQKVILETLSQYKITKKS